MCFLSLGVADEAHKVETNTHALFVDYKNVFENQYHLDVVNFVVVVVVVVVMFLWAATSIHLQRKRKGTKVFNYELRVPA